MIVHPCLGWGYTILAESNSPNSRIVSNISIIADGIPKTIDVCGVGTCDGDGWNAELMKVEVSKVVPSIRRDGDSLLTILFISRIKEFVTTSLRGGCAIAKRVE